MDKDRKPSKEEWHALYQAAIDFKRQACWNWMYEDNIYGVVNPETGETAYCSIMGNGGEHFAVAGYLGAEGLNGILGMLSGKINAESSDSMFTQKCLMCSFEDRLFLAAEDIKCIKELGLKFRGRNEWPLFRHFEVGLVPWFLNASQCRFLTHVLQQSLEVALRCRNSKEILDRETPFTFLIRICQKFGAGEEWVDQYKTAEPYVPDYISFYIQDEIRLKRLKAFKPKQNLIFEADTFYVPTPVKENNRPYFPKIAVLINHHDGLAVSYEMMKDIQKEGYICIEMMVNFIKENKLIPSKVLVSREETYYLFQEACKQLGIPLEMVEHLEHAEEFRNGLYDMINDT